MHGAIHRNTQPESQTRQKMCVELGKQTEISSFCSPGRGGRGHPVTGPTSGWNDVQGLSCPLLPGGILLFPGHFPPLTPLYYLETRQRWQWHKAQQSNKLFMWVFNPCRARLSPPGEHRGRTRVTERALDETNPLDVPNQSLGVWIFQTFPAGMRLMWEELLECFTQGVKTPKPCGEVL